MATTTPDCYSVGTAPDYNAMVHQHCGFSKDIAKPVGKWLLIINHYISLMFRSWPPKNMIMNTGGQNKFLMQARFLNSALRSGYTSQELNIKYCWCDLRLPVSNGQLILKEKLRGRSPDKILTLSFHCSTWCAMQTETTQIAEWTFIFSCEWRSLRRMICHLCC